MKFFHFWMGACPSDTTPLLLRMCKTCHFDSSARFITAFSLLGMTLKLIEMVQILQKKTPIASEMWRNRIQHPDNRFLSEETEKLIRFAFILVYFEHYFFLFLSIYYGQPVLMTPWLVLQSVGLIIKSMLFFLRMFLENSYPAYKEFGMMVCQSFFFMKIYCYQEKILK